MSVSAYMAKACLDWAMGGSPTKPAAWGIGLSLGTPTLINGSEVALGSGWTRQTVSFSAAASPSGESISNIAMTFGPALTAATFHGFQIWDTASSTNGSMLYYGTFATPITLGVTDTLILPLSSIHITLA